ncbi:MAG: DHA2 family efflux MFS transporter permease subunit [Geminicoccaceae bacterium]
MLIPLIVACALFMENLDSTVLATSLPAIAHDFGESPVRLSFAITSYLFSLAVFIPISGWVADRFGARNVFRGAIVVFLTGSILCGLSSSLWQMVAARMLQGLGGAMMVPVGRLVLLRSVAKADLVSAMAWLTVPALIGPVIGPLLGGFITTYFHWRWIFWINVPIAILGLTLVTLFIPAVREPRPPRFDTGGFMLTAAGLVGLMFGFETVGRDIIPGWASALLLVLGLACMALFVRHATRIAHPVLDLRLLEVRTFRASVTGGFLFRMGIGALPFLLPLLLQAGFGLNAFQSGQLTFAAALGALSMKLVAKPILRRFGFRRVLLANAALSAVSLAAIALLRPETPHAVVLAVLLIGGFFRSLQFTSINTLGYADIDAQRMSRATSFASMAQQLSLSAGVATGAILLHLTMAARGGGALQATDFVPAFLAVGVCAALSILVYLRLPPDAGAEVSGHGAQPAPQAR